MKYILLLILILVSFSCTTANPTPTVQQVSQSIATLQNNPTTQAVEADLVAVAGSLLGQPEIAYVAGPAINGLTIAANAINGQINPTAVTGSNLPADAALIQSTVIAAFPKSSVATALKAGQAAAAAYTNIMTAPGVTPSPVTANAALQVISNAITPP